MVKLENFKPCRQGLEWARTYPDILTAWNNCPRGDWMLWFAYKVDIDERKRTLAAAKCANTVRHLMEDPRSFDAVDTALAYGEGRATKEELRQAARAAYAAADAAIAARADAAAIAASDAASYASDAAADAAASYAAAAADAAYAYAAADAAATAASDAAAAASDAAAAASDAAARAKNRWETAEICREILTKDLILSLSACII